MPNKAESGERRAESQTRKVPRSALAFAAGAVEFALGDGAVEGETPIKLLARTGKPVEHPYWGAIVHDMTGMTLRKETCPIDFCHEGKWTDDAIIGVADQFKTSNKGLTISGKLVSAAADDLAARITAKAKAGVPYEASIDFSGPMRIEELSAGTSAQVNGSKFTGPGYIVREWQLRSVAVCPFGADPNTRSQFSSSADAEEEVQITILSESEEPMATEQKGAETKPADDAQALTDPPETPPAESPKQAGESPNQLSADPAGDARAAYQAELRRFCDRFGGENGAKWFAEGKSYEAALELHAAELASQIEAKDKEYSELKAKLDAVPRGEGKPVEFQDGEPARQQQRASELSDKLGPNVARFAAGIKLPDKAKS